MQYCNFPILPWNRFKSVSASSSSDMMNNCFILIYLSQFGESKVWWAPMAVKSKARALCYVVRELMLITLLSNIKYYNKCAIQHTYMEHLVVTAQKYYRVAVLILITLLSNIKYYYWLCNTMVSSNDRQWLTHFICLMSVSIIYW